MSSHSEDLIWEFGCCWGLVEERQWLVGKETAWKNSDLALDSVLSGLEALGLLLPFEILFSYISNEEFV